MCSLKLWNEMQKAGKNFDRIYITPYNQLHQSKASITIHVPEHLNMYILFYVFIKSHTIRDPYIYERMEHVTCYREKMQNESSILALWLGEHIEIRYTFGYIVAVGLNSCIAKRIQAKSESRRINRKREKERELDGEEGSHRKAHLYYVPFWIQFSIVSNHKRCSSTYPIVSYQTNFFNFPWISNICTVDTQRAR